MKALAIALVCVVLGGCYATGQTFDTSTAPPASSQQGYVYFYRQPGSFGGWVASGLYVDGKKVGSLGQNGFTWVAVPSGAHRIGAAWGLFTGKPQVQLTTWIEPGKQYVRLSTQAVRGGNEIRIDRVTDAIALAEMRGFKYQPAAR